MTPMTARSMVSARPGMPVNRRRRYPHRGPRFAWKMRRKALIARAKERIREGWYDESPVLRIAIDRLIQRLHTELDSR